MGGSVVMEGDVTWWGGHAKQGTDDVLQRRAPETCMILFTSITSINSPKIKINK